MLKADTEITMEMNPNSVNDSKVEIYKQAGINRVSMGLQSANNEETVRKYIREQETADIALDKLSVKEYEDPFKGSK